MKLIAGLGNFEDEYKGTRHNMGFDVIDGLAMDLDLSLNKVQFDGMYTKFNANGETILLVEPLTHMNLSGICISQFMNYYKIPIEDLIVVCDDMAIKPGDYKIKIKGSSGGQKGLQNIIERIGSEDFKRIRIGIGEPQVKSKAADFVLGKPSKEERELINNAQDEVIEFLHICIKYDFAKALNYFSAKKAKEHNAK